MDERSAPIFETKKGPRSARDWVRFMLLLQITLGAPISIQQRTERSDLSTILAVATAVGVVQALAMTGFYCFLIGKPLQLSRWRFFLGYLAFAIFFNLFAVGIGRTGNAVYTAITGHPAPGSAVKRP